MECQSGARSGAAPAGISAADISACLPESVGQGSLVTEDQREVCPLSGRVISPGGSTLIRSITDRLSLSPSSFTRRPVSFPYESLSPCGRTTGLPRFVDMPEVGRSQLSAGGASSASGDCQAPEPDHMPFWPKRDSIFRLF